MDQTQDPPSAAGRIARFLSRRLDGAGAVLRKLNQHDASLRKLEERSLSAADLSGAAADLSQAVVDLARRQDSLSEEVARLRLQHETGLRELRLLLGRMTLPPAESWRALSAGPDGEPGENVFPYCTLCRQESFEQPYFAYWVGKFTSRIPYHRKLWEFVFILQALSERGALQGGARGLGFGVGAEPLSAYFAGLGCRITATDMALEAATEAGWTRTEEHAAGKAALRVPWLCPDEAFEANVDFRTCDMNAVPDDLTGYDFCWSACALEHLGSIDKGLEFIERSLACLKPGGLAIHTTEFNLSSNDETVAQGGTVLFRKRDLVALRDALAAKGHEMAPLDLDPGDGLVDRYLDVPPYREEPHLKLMLEGYATTSVGLIIRRGGV